MCIDNKQYQTDQNFCFNTAPLIDNWKEHTKTTVIVNLASKFTINLYLISLKHS